MFSLCASGLQDESDMTRPMANQLRVEMMIVFILLTSNFWQLLYLFKYHMPQIGCTPLFFRDKIEK
jgi:hypothetical protein